MREDYYYLLKLSVTFQRTILLSPLFASMADGDETRCVIGILQKTEAVGIYLFVYLFIS